MQFKVIGKSLILTDFSHKITRGENLYDKVEIILPRYHDDIDNSLLSHRLTVVSENSSKAAAIILLVQNCTEKSIILTGKLNEIISNITGNAVFILTCINEDEVVGKFSSIPFMINDDPSFASLPDVNIAEQILNRTQLEAEKAIKASQTPAPAEIYPATSERLGGVKVDGKTIIASADGTISVLENEALKNEIKNTNALSVQIAHPNNFLIYDDIGKPSVMVAIPKFYLDEVIDGASHTVHPAFIVNGVEQNVIYISKYQNIVENGRAYSLPMKSPQTYVSFDQAYNYCKSKGTGWHLMTNAEWAAIALWCRKNGSMPRGNNNRGKDISETNLPPKAIVSARDNQERPNKILTGSGCKSWFHDNSFAGIADLNGNSWEWNSGLRLVDGEIQILADNNAADQNNPVSADSILWKAIMPDGSLVSPGAPGTLKYDWKSNKCTVSTSIENKSTTGRSNSFESLTADSGVNIPEILKCPALFPADSSGYEGDYFYMVNSGEYIPIRGGDWVSGTRAGLFSLSIDYKRAATGSSTGFRCAYYDSNT